MATLRPFRAVRPHPDHVERVASVPYDVVDREEAAALAAGNPDSFLHVVRSEIDLPADCDPHDDAVYATAATRFSRLLGSGVLLRETLPVLYLYRQVMGEHSQTAVVGCCAVDEYDDDTIRKHEKTRPDKENDRTRHILEIGAQSGPVFLTYRGNPAIDHLVTEASAAPPLFDFVAPDGVRHSVWKLDDPGPLVDAFARVGELYVADGHHRSAAASRARQVRRDENPDHRGDEEYNFFLAALFPAESLAILPYNRLVQDLAGQTPDELLQRLREVMKVTPCQEATPEERGAFCLYLEGAWYRLDAPKALLEQDDPVASMDAAILQSLVLGPILGIDDPRTSDRIAFVGGIRGTDELAQRVDSGRYAAAFSLYPVSLAQLMAVADAGEVLPPKSTWFEPKLRSGLLIHEI